MPTISYKEKAAAISPSLLSVFLSAATKHASISVSPPTLLPGQGFEVTWKFQWLTAKQEFPQYPSIHVEISWENHVIATGPAPGGHWLNLVQNLQTSGETINIPPEDVPDDFYRPGAKQIDLAIEWNGKDWDGATSGKVTSSDWLAVTLDAPVANWWDWTSPTWRPGLDIHESYHLTGTITNRHKYADAAAVTAILSKWEEGDEGDKHEVSTKTADPLPLAPGAEAAINFGKFSESWDWMDDCKPWTIVPSKTYFYQVSLDVLDKFGNHYQDTVPETSGVTASVPASTRAEAAFACGVSVGGWVSKVIGWLAPAGAALIGGSYYLEDWLAKAPLIAPQPDRDFQSKVTRPEIPFDPEGAAFGEGLPATRRFLRTGLEIRALDGMRSAILGKILGARAAGQRADERNQRKTYSDTLADLKRQVKGLEKLGDYADAELFQLVPQGQARLPGDVRLEGLKGSETLAPEVLDGFMDFLALPDLEQCARNSQSFRAVAEAVAQVMNGIEEEDTKMLTGGSGS